MFNLTTVIFLLILTLGIFSQVSQALLIRDLLVVFYGNEISVGAFYGCWLFWIAIGSILIAYIKDRLLRPLDFLRVIVLLLPFAFIGQILLSRMIRFFMDTASVEFVALGDLLTSIFLITAPSAILLGLAFPIACVALSQSISADHNLQADTHGVSRLYVIEAAGAFAGGILVTFVLLEWLGTWGSLGFVLCLMAGFIYLLSGEVAWKKSMLIFVLGVVMMLPVVSGGFSNLTEGLRFKTLHPGLTLKETLETRFGHVVVSQFGQQISIVRDGKVSESFPDVMHIASQAAYFYSQSQQAENLLLLGGLIDGLAVEFLNYPIKKVDVLEQDKQAFQHIYPYFSEKVKQLIHDPRMTVLHRDGREYVNHSRGKREYDLVLILNQDPASSFENRFYTVEFYQQIALLMSDDGVLCTQVESASNYLGKDVRTYSAVVFNTLVQVFPEIVVSPGDTQVFCASKQKNIITDHHDVLEKRYGAIDIENRTFPGSGFVSWLPPQRIQFVRAHLSQEKTEINTDMKPVTYFLNMKLWGKYTDSGVVDFLNQMRSLAFWPYIIPLATLMLLMIIKFRLEKTSVCIQQSNASIVVLFMMGLSAMAIEIILLFSYQAQVGFVFSRVALLNGLFMTGLALGAGLLGQLLVRLQKPVYGLIGVVVVLVMFSMTLPEMIALMMTVDSAKKEMGYMGLVTVTGLLTGAGFPLAVFLSHQNYKNMSRTSGFIEAADHFGGALGGLLTGGLIIPLLGVQQGCYLLGLLLIVAVVPLLMSLLNTKSACLGVGRGYRTFPVVRFSWGLLWTVLMVYLFVVLGLSMQPGPKLYFSQDKLAQVSGSEQFKLHEQPPMYLGESPHNDATVTLATMAVASDINGYAGPLNLLVSMSDQGVIRGVKYVYSNETPSYIENISTWLNQLSGLSIKAQSLDLTTLDAMSGATISSQAALASIRKSSQIAGQVAFAQNFVAQNKNPQWQEHLFTLKWWLLVIVLLLFLPVYFSASDKPRIGYQVLVLVVLGVVYNMLITEIDLVNISMGQLPSFDVNPYWYLLTGFVLVYSVLFGQVYCGYICPFGAMQELISRLGRWVGLRRYANYHIDKVARYLKYVLLSLALMVVWIAKDISWITFNPMQYFFSFNFKSWLLGITLVSLLGALFYYRFWCRYFCPAGVFFALFNKIALLSEFAPKRQFRRCDLGVRDEFDVDCIHCNRCIHNVDLGMGVK